MVATILSLPFEVRSIIFDQIPNARDLKNITCASPELKDELNKRIYAKVMLFNGNSKYGPFLHGNSKVMDEWLFIDLENGKTHKPIEGCIEEILLKNEGANRLDANIINSFAKFTKLNIPYLQNLETLVISDLYRDAVPLTFEIPKGLTNLKVLKLENNGLTEVPGIGHLENLEQLYLNHNALTSLKSLPELPNLEELYLSYNPLESLDNDIHKVINLCALGALSCKLKYVSGVQSLKSLEWLNLRDNKIYELKDFQNLVNLSWLCLEKNDIREIMYLDSLDQLEELYLGQNNNLTEIKNLENLTELRVLDLNDCNIHRIENLDKLRNLEILHLEKNYIREVDNIGRLTKLEFLGLADNWRIEELKDIEKLKNLKTLAIRRTDIKSLEILKNPKLKTLELGDVRDFSYLNDSVENLRFDSCFRPNWISHLKNKSKLKKVTFINVGIEKVPDFEGSTNIENLYLSNCPIANLEGLDKLKSLKSLSLCSSEISQLMNFDALRNLTYLEIFKSKKLKKIEGLKNLTKLKCLKIISSRILSTKGLNVLVDLEELDLRYNSIRKISGLSTLKKLRKLCLNNCAISRIEGLEELTSLEALGLRNCKISVIEGISRLTNLKYLDLYNNYIEQIKGLDSLIKLMYLDLSYNRLIKIENLSAQKKLRYLSLFANNEISTFENLDNCLALQTLHLPTFGDQRVFFELKRFRRLSELWIQYEPNFSLAKKTWKFLDGLLKLKVGGMSFEWDNSASFDEKFETLEKRLIYARAEFLKLDLFGGQIAEKNRKDLSPDMESSEVC